ncbi:hypothetical protein [Tengunoibacter tsumagoiensis]|uniref:Uncharacterized protein n=1 Tax=Tengunoibacter tsumagoiensis TaxID=2014871 RepID=A0A402A544_9CHLR|nr:hypothetical protein [Tengunoibacter tsumagoiensis]GCE14214.1 hypothetical protein KTT_40730 [Tengunoibacter tsumagoiensis]GCE14268.1 hypothetical protein KTT_41270 [Tengunoibacter tsumagoiensis]
MVHLTASSLDDQAAQLIARAGGQVEKSLENDTITITVHLPASAEVNLVYPGLSDITIDVSPHHKVFLKFEDTVIYIVGEAISGPIALCPNCHRPGVLDCEGPGETPICFACFVINVVVA